MVVPVFHEADNIGPFCRAVRESFPPGYELLVCYDMDEDRTLPALAALPATEKPETVRLVRNDLFCHNFAVLARRPAGAAA